MAKYRVIEPEKPQPNYTEVCIGCGVRRSRYSPFPGITANPTDTRAPSWFECKMAGLHNYVDIRKVELI